MRRFICAILLFALVVAAQGIGFGFTVAPRVLFPLHDPYELEVYIDDIERGVMAGFSFSFDLRLFPGFTVGPYLGGLFSTDTFPLQWDVEGKLIWTDLVFGAHLKYSIPTGGSIRPWLSVAPGYGFLSCTVRIEDPYATSESDYDNTGGFGLDAGIGVDYRISEMFFVGFGAHVHLNTADRVKRVVYGDTYELELEESPVGLGFGIEVGVSF